MTDKKDKPKDPKEPKKPGFWSQLGSAAANVVGEWFVNR